MSLASRFRDLIKPVDDLTLRELGRLAGIAETTPSLIANGSREEIGRKTATGLARVLGCTTDYLLSGTGEPPHPDEVRAAVARARSLQLPAA